MENPAEGTTMIEHVTNTQAMIDTGSLGSETVLHAALRNGQKEILGKFSPEQQQVIQYRLAVIRPIASFIGKDFKMPVELNEPGQGWHWDFKENKTRVDPLDLVETMKEWLSAVLGLLL